MTWTFNPFWLASRAPDEEKAVQQWLREAGLNLNLTPGFDYDGALITTRYYAVNEMGQAMVDLDGQFIFEDQVREFPAKNPPKVIEEGMKHA